MMTDAEAIDRFFATFFRLNVCPFDPSAHVAALRSRYLEDATLVINGDLSPTMTGFSRWGRDWITTLPAEIGLLTSLRKLFLREAGVMVLPTEIGRLMAITYLDLRSTGITVLPAEIGWLTALEILDLRSTGITATICHAAVRGPELGGGAFRKTPEGYVQI